MKGGNPPRLLECTGDYRALARRLGVEYLDRLPEERLLTTEAECLRLLRSQTPVARAILPGEDDRHVFVLAPTALGAGWLRHLRDASPKVRGRFRVTHSRILRAAMMQRASAALTRYATHGLADEQPDLSARMRVSPRQGLALGILLAVVLGMLVVAPAAFLDMLRVAGAALFLAVSLLRIAAALARPPPPAMPDPPPDEACPVYTVLVALRHEAAMVPQLLASLGRLDWPRDRLEIKLVCEADDAATVEAIRAHALRDFVEVVVAPPSLPMTKPKALRYALPAATGEFVVLYDAEDRPHPMQLKEAWARFRATDRELACLQAPLEIANGGCNWLTRMFAFEYAGLFRVLLPWLARIGAVMPLGGTSNHFRRAALEHVGAWDPHNVTEDADLGLRLRRFGYRCGVIGLPTYEDAPETLRVWLNQRARWSKGWLQTWLVHMRRPRQLLGELGPASFLISQVLMLGIVLSSMMYPILLLMLLWTLVTVSAGERLDLLQTTVEGPSVILGYVGFLWLGFARAGAAERLGAWRAVYDLWRRPFHWNKTPHRPRRDWTRPG